MNKTMKQMEDRDAAKGALLQVQKPRRDVLARWKPIGISPWGYPDVHG
jgi:hypothetical protein